MKCVNHLEAEARLMCMKDGVYLCGLCLSCRNPEIFCKFRTSCPVWFLKKASEKWESAEEPPKEGAAGFRVRFEPHGVQAETSGGATLLDAARGAGVYLNASCNGFGSCGKCRLVVESGEVETESTPLLTESEKKKGYVLACRTAARSDVTVRIPEETLEKKLRAAGLGAAATGRLRGRVAKIDPMFFRLYLALDPPTLLDSASDADRLSRAMRKAGFGPDDPHVGLDVIRKLAAEARANDWNISAAVFKNGCVNEVVDVGPPIAGRRPLGLAIDIGTTSIVVYLVDMADGAVLAAASGHNGQAACGDDVINRIVCAEKDGVRKLSELALGTINGLIAEALESAGGDAGRIENVAVSGNTTMVHLFLRIDPRYIRREPYVPASSQFPVVNAGELGLNANPRAAVFIVPGPAGYVGGDIVSGILFAGFHREQPRTLFIDVGTNGEIVLGNKEWMMAASASAGPAFEGGGVRWGMRAEEGAIEKVDVDRGTFAPRCSTVGGAPPRGICGSGMIDLISEMLLNGIIDRAGKFLLDPSHPRMKIGKYGPEYVVAFAYETGIGEDIIFTEPDVDNIMRAKGAVYAGLSVLLKEAGLRFSDVDRVCIAGGFGQRLDIDKAVTIGLLPDIDRCKFEYLGNTSVAGAYLALLSGEKRAEALAIAKGITYIDFSSNLKFMEEYTSALFFPHTDIEAFPSVAKKILPSAT
jgi:uncharacterized 2Fe-2S/4Fe-4S cluster protein (DUF4445 family)